jgi:hypothetical protein
MIGNVLQPSFYTTGVNGYPTKGILTGGLTLTGTFASTTTSPVIIGTGSKFKAELQCGDWLYSTTTNEVRRIKVIYSDLSIGLNKPFSSAATTDNVIIARRGYPRNIVVRDTGSGGVTKLFGDNSNGSWNQFSNGYATSYNNSESGINPMTYDASAANAQVSVTISY